MKKIIFKMIGVVISIILLFSTICFAATQSDLNNVNSKINKAEEELEDVKSQKSEVVKEVENLTTQINNYQAQIDELDNQISTLNGKIEESQKKLNEAQENYEKQEKLLNERLVETYMAGETSYLDFLLSSESITDFISNYYLVSEVAKADTELLEKIEKQKQEIEQAKQELETSKQELATSKASKQSVSTQLQTAKNEKNAQVAKLSKEEQDIQKEIDYLEEQSRIIESQIKAANKKYEDKIQQFTGSSNGQYIWPVPGYYSISSNYGMRYHPIYHDYRMHTGIDIAGAPLGANFVAVADGVVTLATYNGGYGNFVSINHGNGVESRYAHGSSILVSAGQTVTKGTPVLKVGSTGTSTGVHAHFEMKINGSFVNPLSYVSR